MSACQHGLIGPSKPHPLQATHEDKARASTARIPCDEKTEKSVLQETCHASKDGVSKEAERLLDIEVEELELERLLKVRAGLEGHAGLVGLKLGAGLVGLKVGLHGSAICSRISAL